MGETTLDYNTLLFAEQLTKSLGIKYTSVFLKLYETAAR